MAVDKASVPGTEGDQTF